MLYQPASTCMPQDLNYHFINHDAIEDTRVGAFRTLTRVSLLLERSLSEGYCLGIPMKLSRV